MERFEKDILDEHRVLLQQTVITTDILPSLKAKGVIEKNEAMLLKSDMKQPQDKFNQLFQMLKTSKKKTAFNDFIDSLSVKDAYKNIQGRLREEKKKRLPRKDETKGGIQDVLQQKEKELEFLRTACDNLRHELKLMSDRLKTSQSEKKKLEEQMIEMKEELTRKTEIIKAREADYAELVVRSREDSIACKMFIQEQQQTLGEYKQYLQSLQGRVHRHDACHLPSRPILPSIKPKDKSKPKKKKERIFFIHDVVGSVPTYPYHKHLERHWRHCRMF